jgi:hypothetical protein
MLVKTVIGKIQQLVIHYSFIGQNVHDIILIITA